MAGIKGRSGRKAYWEEKQDAEFLDTLWNEGFSKQELKEKLSQDKVPGMYIMAAKFYQGDKAVMMEVMRKILPDKVDVNGNIIVPINIRKG